MGSDSAKGNLRKRKKSAALLHKGCGEETRKALNSSSRASFRGKPGLGFTIYASAKGGIEGNGQRTIAWRVIIV